IARGHFTEADMEQVQARLSHLMATEGVPLGGFHHCPHHPDGSVAGYAIHCTCRKPFPGLIQAAAREHGVRLVDSWLIGDILDDVEAGNRAGCRTVLLDNGGETEWYWAALRQPTAMVSNLYEAALHILAQTEAAKAVEPLPESLLSKAKGGIQ
ncbi:MAG: HAD-IIIA family hydrolase, partial [Dehalococcoidia bacterium]